MADTSTDPRRTVVAWTFVAIQAALLVGIVAAPRDGTWLAGEAVRAIGLVLVGAGVVIGLWAAAHLGRGLTPSPLPNGAVGLISQGPYRWVRHPMYVAVMAFVAGVALRAGSVAVVGQSIALVILFNVKAGWEERQLAAAFPGYAAYRQATPRFVPLTKPGA